MLEIKTKADLLALATAYAAAEGISISTAGVRATGDGTLFVRIQQGHDSSFTVRKFDEAVKFFDENWPACTPWPKGVARPSRVRKSKTREAARLRRARAA